MIRICSILLLALVLCNESSFSASVIGKISSTVNSKKQIYPFLTDEVTSFNHDSVVTIRGGKLIVDKGTIIKPTESEGRIYFKVAKGRITFKLFPEKTRITFQTPNGDIATPDIVTASVNTIQGELVVEKEETTILQVNQGSVDVITQSGSLNLLEGESIVLAQADLEQPNEKVVPISNSPANPNPRVSSKKSLPVGILSYMRLAGDKGITTTPLTPTGRIRIKDIENAGYNARVVDTNMQTLPGETINENTNVKVVCSAIDGTDPTLVVRPYDNYYPETVREKSLIGLEMERSVDQGSSGYYNIVVSDEAEKARLSKFRSLVNWQVDIVDPKTLGPISDESQRTDEKINSKDNGSGESATKRVLCIKSTLVLQEVNEADPAFYGLVGRKVITKDLINPGGKVLLDGELYDGLLVDYNLQPIKGAEVTPGRTLEIVGVKKGSTILLLQFPGIVQEEIPNFVGKTVTGITELDPYGVVTVNGEEWLGVVVDSQFNPITNSVASSSQFRVVSAQTILLIQSDPVILAAYYAPATGIASVTSPTVTTAVITTATVGGIIAGGILISNIDDDDDGGDDVDPPISPINP
ncbi:MAG: hypothetical protein ACR2NW_01935 [Thermodesulfobacteriota bacterium]